MSESVLIIDDSPPIHKLIGVHLQPDGMTLHSAFDGENGLIMAARLLPGLILLDIDMPGRDGLDVCRQLKADTKTGEIPVMFITASSASDHRFNGLQLGALDYVSKPFKPTELRAKVAAIFQIQSRLEAACPAIR
jgi:two-component system cell cycle response regulator